MTDLLHVLPDFALGPYSHLIPSLERAYVTTADLLTLDGAQVARRARLPAADVGRLATHVLRELQTQLGLDGATEHTLRATGSDLLAGWSAISTLDPVLDAALGGGIAAGHVTEITGESGAGKTQLLLALLLAAQLPPPRGRAAKAIYISTEHALPTTRLKQLLASHPLLARDGEADDGNGSEADGGADGGNASIGGPSLSNILTLQIPDLEMQDHILTYQLPVALAAHRPGVVVLDSIAANYRDGASSARALAARSANLQRTGALLRRLAREHRCAIVVANQVADRFAPVPPTSGASSSQRTNTASNSARRTLHPPSSLPLSSQSGEHAPSSSPSPATDPASASGGRAHHGFAPVPDYDDLALPLHLQQRGIALHPALALDHQQCFFTGWGLHDPHPKTPALGLVWANQIACRIALIKEPAWGVSATAADHETSSAEWAPRRWRRWMRLVFAPWAQPTPGKGVEFEVWAGGVRALPA